MYTGKQERTWGWVGGWVEHVKPKMKKKKRRERQEVLNPECSLIAIRRRFRRITDGFPHDRG